MSTLLTLEDLVDRIVELKERLAHIEAKAARLEQLVVVIQNKLNQVASDANSPYGCNDYR